MTGLGAAPWVVKPVYGFLSDTVPIFGYRRRSYLIICGLLGRHTALAAPPPAPPRPRLVMRMHSMHVQSMHPQSMPEQSMQMQRIEMQHVQLQNVQEQSI